MRNDPDNSGDYVSLGKNLHRRKHPSELRYKRRSIGTTTGELVAFFLGAAAIAASMSLVVIAVKFLVAQF